MKKIFSSPRFWLLFLTGVGIGLQSYISTPNVLLAVATAIAVWTGSSAVVGTVDRYADKKVEAAKLGNPNA